ncbi:hypothetical protein, partial [Chitinophaga sancti]|uniref:hypothetical protein n=1 Tax=Chitinophaga sancti TaxID=1004 RepID=UPI003F79F059
MQITGKFQVTDAFNSRDNKGIVVLGKLLEGTVTIGNLISFITKMGEKTIYILEIEKGQSVSGRSFMGFLIKLKDPSDLDELNMLSGT